MKSEFRFRLFINLFRGLFPRWNFFDVLGFHFHLYFKTPGATQWEQVTFDIPRRPFQLFFNPLGNLALIQANVLEQLAVDIQNLSKAQSTLDSEEVQALTTFKLIRSTLQLKLQEYGIQTGTTQFKIVASSSSEEIDVYVSDWISLEPQ